MKLKENSLILLISVPLLLAAAAWAAPREQVLHAFQSATAAFPNTRLTSDSAGNLYGVTLGGGIHHSLRELSRALH